MGRELPKEPVVEKKTAVKPQAASVPKPKKEARNPYITISMHIVCGMTDHFFIDFLDKRYPIHTYHRPLEV